MFHSIINRGIVLNGKLPLVIQLQKLEAVVPNKLLVVK